MFITNKQRNNLILLLLSNKTNSQIAEEMNLTFQEILEMKAELGLGDKTPKTKKPLILIELAKGKSVKEIASALKVSEAYVYQYS